jgi:large subunit ribosomal protein L19
MSNSFTYKNLQLTVGDRIAVHQKIEEEGKIRTQVFEGILIATKGREDNRTFIVRKIAVNNIGVERIFPVLSPLIDDITLKSKGHTRRAKLYYLRGRSGRKALRVKGPASGVQSKKPGTNSRKASPAVVAE